jgi:photosystem II stability/assembly factor-like uncharacterized protein
MYQVKTILAVLMIVSLSGCKGKTVVERVTSLDRVKEQKPVMRTDDDTLSIRKAVYRSEDYGATWLPASEGLPTGVQASFFDRKGNEIVMATDNHGLFISERNKTSWKSINGDLPGDKINAVHVFGNEIYAAVYREGIFMSTDNGESWVSLNGNLKNVSVRAIVKVNTGLLVATDEGIYKTDNKVLDWRQKFAGEQVSSLNEFDGRIIAGSVSGVLLSTDGGENWNFINTGDAAHNTAIIEGRVFVMYISGNVFMTDNWGIPWVLFDYAPRKQSYVYELTKVGDHLMMSNNYGVFKSNDWGRTWEHIHKEEKMVFIDFIVFDTFVYAGTRGANEYRNRK